MSTEIILIIVIVFCVIMAILKATVWSDKAQKNQTLKKAESQLNEDQLRWARTVGRLFGENRAMSMLDVYVECGMPQEIAFSKDVSLIQQNIPYEKDSDGYNVIMTYAMAISRRKDLMNSPLVEIPAENYGLNLKNDEHIFNRINIVTLYKEKTTQMNIVYSGVRWQSGMLRAGSMNVIGQDITRFSPVDCGRLLFTNKRLLFVGAQKNTTIGIEIDKILYTTMYKDGVMVHQANQKPLLFKFDEKNDFGLLQINDGMFEFMTVLARLKDGTQNKNLNHEG